MFWTPFLLQRERWDRAVTAGTCQAGGNQDPPLGTAFRLTPRSGGHWTSTVLHSFPADKTYVIWTAANLLKSRPSPPFLIRVLAVVTIAAVLPYMAVGTFLRFTLLPVALTGACFSRRDLPVAGTGCQVPVLSATRATLTETTVHFTGQWSGALVWDATVSASREASGKLFLLEGRRCIGLRLLQGSGDARKNVHRYGENDCGVLLHSDFS